LEGFGHMRIIFSPFVSDFPFCVVDTYIPACQYLMTQGYYVLRMGYVVEKKLNINNSHIIDYANQYRTDFGDIFLSAKCQFFVSTTGGLMNIAWAFNVPVAFTNMVPPFQVMGYRQGDLFIIKKMWDKREKKLLSFRDMLERKIDQWSYSQLFKDADIEIIENTDEELVALTEEMSLRVRGQWKTRQEDEERQRRFQCILPADHHCHGFSARIGSTFIDQNQYLLN